MPEVDVASFADLDEGVPKRVKAFGREIVLVRWSGECFAVRNICPHQTVAFAGDTSTGKLAQGQVRAGECFGDVSVDAANPVIRCPRHAYKFELHSGNCTVDARLRIKTYPVSVRDGRVFVGSA